MPSLETVVIGVLLLVVVVVLWKFLIGFLKLGLSILAVVAIVWGGMMILQSAGVDFSKLNRVSSEATTSAKHVIDKAKTSF